MHQRYNLIIRSKKRKKNQRKKMKIIKMNHRQVVISIFGERKCNPVKKKAKKIVFTLIKHWLIRKQNRIKLIRTSLILLNSLIVTTNIKQLHHNLKNKKFLLVLNNLQKENLIILNLDILLQERVVVDFQGVYPLSK